MKEKLVDLLKQIAHGRPNAAEELADVLIKLLEVKEAPKKAK